VCVVFYLCCWFFGLWFFVVFVVCFSVIFKLVCFVVVCGENFMDDLVRKRVQAALDDIRPQIQLDGGDVELVDVVDNVVRVRLVGHCAGCPMAQMTLKNGIEAHVRACVPEIQRVDSV